MPGHFDRHADDWIAWTSTPGVDVYDLVSKPGFWPLLPKPGELTLDVGCGEGRVSRDLAADGHRAVSVDVSERLLGAARRADPSGRLVLGDAERLPIDDASADLVVSFNVLMDVDDLGAACREISRVLRPRGRVCLCVTHPLTDAVAAAEGPDGERHLRLSRPYGGTHPFDSVATRLGVTMHFRGWSHSFEVYFSAFAEAGLVVERLGEVAADAHAVANVPALADFTTMPMFLTMRLTHGQGGRVVW